MHEKKARERRSKQAKTSENPQPQIIPIEQVLEMQFAKVGRLGLEIDIMRQQMVAFENENKKLKAQLEKKKK